MDPVHHSMYVVLAQSIISLATEQEVELHTEDVSALINDLIQCYTVTANCRVLDEVAVFLLSMVHGQWSVSSGLMCCSSTTGELRHLLLSYDRPSHSKQGTTLGWP